MPVAAALLTAGQAASTATPATAVISPTAGRPVLLAVAAHPAGGPVQPTASGAGLTWTVVRYNSYDPTNSGETLTVFIGAGTPAAGAVTIDFGGQTQVGVVWGITELTGADTVGTIVQSVPAQGNSATALATLSAMTAGNATMAFAAVGSLGWQPLPGAGFAALHTTRGTGGVGIGLLSEWRADTDTSADASLAVADPWGIVAVEIKAAVSAPPQIVAVAQVSETDLAQALAATHVRGTAQAAESDQPQSINVSQPLTAGQATETDLAQALAATHVRGTAQAAESDQPQSINVSQPLTAGQATETDSAQTLAASQTAAVASASEADSAQSLVVAQAISVAQAVESDAAQEITALGVTVVQQASETGTAQPIAGRHVVAVTQSAEQDTAQSITRSINITVNQANESNAAQAITGVQPATLSAVGEFDAAQPIAIGGFAIIDQVLEFNVAHPITPIIFHTQTSLVDAGGGLKPKRRVRRSVLPIAALFRPKPEEEERVRLAPIPDAMIDAIVAASLAPVDPWAKAREEEAELMRWMEEHA